MAIPRTMKDILMKVFRSNLSMPMAQPTIKTATGVVAYTLVSVEDDFCLDIANTDLQHLDECHA